VFNNELLAYLLCCLTETPAQRFPFCTPSATDVLQRTTGNRSVDEFNDLNELLKTQVLISARITDVL